MRYAQIDKCECCNGNDIGVSLFTQGCPIRCAGCQNSSIWDFNGGQIYDSTTQQYITTLLQKPYIKRFSILGGEPLLDRNIQELAHLCSHVKQLWPQKEIWLWSGYLWEDIYLLAFNNSCHTLGTQKEWSWQEQKALRNILFNVDILVDGPFIQEQKDITLKWRGSKNQRVIRCKDSIEFGLQYANLPPIPVLYCD